MTPIDSLGVFSGAEAAGDWRLEDDVSKIKQVDLQVPAGVTVDFPDVVHDVFAADGITGNLILEVEGAPLLVSSRTATADPAGGSYGQFVGATGLSDDIAQLDGPALLLPQMADNGRFRTNIGFSELRGHSASVEVTVFDGDTGALIDASTTHPVPAFSHFQVRLRTNADHDNLYARIRVVEGAGGVVGSVLGFDQAAGSLRILHHGDATPVLVTSRAYNLVDNTTYGQFIEAVTGGFTDTAHIIHVDGDENRRTNLGLCETAGAELWVRCTLFDSVGRRLGEPTVVPLQPFELFQINDIFGYLHAPRIDNTRLEIKVEQGEGAYVAYASVIDGVTGDAVSVPAQTLGN